jgi:hypothetical protein
MSKTVEELVQEVSKLTDRLRQVENSSSRMTGGVVFVGVILSALLLLYGLGKSSGDAGRIESDIKTNNVKLENHIKNIGAKLESDIVPKTSHTSYGPEGDMHEHSGKIVRMSKEQKQIVLETLHGKSHFLGTFPLDLKATVVLRGTRNTTIDDLRVGMYVQVWHKDGDDVTYIVHIEPPPGITPALTPTSPAPTRQALAPLEQEE